MNRIIQKISLSALCVLSLAPFGVSAQEMPKETLWEVFAPVGKEVVHGIAAGIQTAVHGTISVLGTVLGYCGTLCLSQTKKHPKAIFLTALAAWTAYASKISYTSWLHARGIINTIASELRSMDYEKCIIPLEISDGSIPDDIVRWLTTTFRTTLIDMRAKILRHYGICMCPNFTMSARLMNAFDTRQKELIQLRGRLQRCKGVGKQWYYADIKELEGHIDSHLRTNTQLRCTVEDNRVDINRSYKGFKGALKCGKHYCLTKQQGERSVVCTCNQDHRGPGFTCPACSKQS